ncbi:MAG: hypothetical protein R3257_02995 [bacterium]|nr:hypothetical protein [bacterium]
MKSRAGLFAQKPQFVFQKSYRFWALTLMGIGFITLGVGLFTDPTRAWGNLLINNFYFTTLALAGAFFIAVLYVSNAGWWVNLKRVPEAMTSYLPLGLVLMLLLFFGMHSLYHWTHHDAVLHDPLLQHKSAYLNIPFFFIRMVGYFAIWIFFCYLFRRISRKQDESNDLKYHRRNVRVSAIFIIIFALTFSFASFDWIMSLEPHWYSTIFAVYTWASLFLHGLAAITLMVIILMERGFFGRLLTVDHLHDLGKLLFAFSTFWAYIWVSQYLLIWYSDIPEESVYYVVRTDSNWIWLFLLNLVLNWLIPFVFLMSRAAKRSAMMLKRICVVLLIGYWLDIFLLVAPNVMKGRNIGIFEILVSLGFGGLFVYVTSRALERAPLISRGDPYLQESLHLHQLHQ